MTDIFVSYASEDRDRVAGIVAGLEDAGFSVWWDRHIQTGAAYDRQIEAAVADADCMVVVWSTASVDSEYVRSEVEEGAARGILVPLRIDACDIPLAHRRRQTADLSDWSSGSDVQFEALIAGVRSVLSGEPVLPTTTVVRKRQPPQWVLLSVVLVVGLLVGYLVSMDKEAANESLRMELYFGTDNPVDFYGATWGGVESRPFDISPDGKHVVAVVAREDGPTLLVKNLATGRSAHLDGTTGAYRPIFSPDGTSIAYFSENKLFRVDKAGSPPRMLAETVNPMGSDWDPDGYIYVSLEEGSNAKIVRVNAESGTLEVLSAAVPGIGEISMIAGTSYLLVDQGGSLMRISKQTGEVTPVDTIDRQVTSMRFTQDLLFFHGFGGDSIHAVQMSRDYSEFDSEPVEVLSGVRTDRVGQWAVSGNGTLVYAEGVSASMNPVRRVGPEIHEDLDLPVRSRAVLRLSRDGRFLYAMEMELARPDLWRYDLARDTSVKLASDVSGPLVDLPANGGIVFHLNAVARRRAENRATDQENLLPELTGWSVYSVADSGDRFGVTGRGSNAGSIAVYDLSTQQLLKLPVDTRRLNWGTSVSPNGQWVAYVSDEGGTNHIYLQPVPPNGQRFRISRLGDAEEPRWDADGGTIFYRNKHRIMRSSFTGLAEPKLGKPEIFVETRFTNLRHSYDVFPDGRSVVLLEDPQPTTDHLSIVTNWMSGVQEQLKISEN